MRYHLGSEIVESKRLLEVMGSVMVAGAVGSSEDTADMLGYRWTVKGHSLDVLKACCQLGSVRAQMAEKIMAV